MYLNKTIADNRSGTLSISLIGGDKRGKNNDSGIVENLRQFRDPTNILHTVNLLKS